MCVTPREPLLTKNSYYNDHFKSFSHDGFIQRLRYIYLDVYMLHSASKVGLALPYNGMGH